MSFRNFVNSWAHSHSKRVCGIHAGAAGCHDSGVIPGPTEFVVDTAIATVSGKIKLGFEALYNNVRNAVEDALESIE